MHWMVTASEQHDGRVRSVKWYYSCLLHQSSHIVNISCSVSV